MAMALKTNPQILLYCTAMQIACISFRTTGNGVVVTRYRQFIIAIYYRSAQDRIRSSEHGRNGQCGEYVIALLLRRLVNGRNRETRNVLWVVWSS